MKEGNNIDKFFKKRLDSSSAEEADWNVPSDDIWDAAKVHFPKEKKRRPFGFWLFGLGLIVLAFVLWNTFSTNALSNSNTTSNSNSITTSTLNSISNADSEKINESQNNDSRGLNLPSDGHQAGDNRSSNTTSTSTTKSTSNENSNSTAALKTDSDLDNNQNRELSDSRSSTSEDNLKATVAKSKAATQPPGETRQTPSLNIPNKKLGTKKSVNSNPLIDLPSSDARNKLKINVNNGEPEAASIKTPTPIATSKKENSNSSFFDNTDVPLVQIDDIKNNKREENNITSNEDIDNINDGDKLNNNHKNKSSSLDIANKGLSTLPGLRLAQLNKNTLNLEVPGIKALEVIEKRPIYKWEVGLSHAPFIFNPFSVANADVEFSNDFNLTSTYRNINFHLTKRLGSRFSLSSGAYYSTLDVNLDFDFRDAYNADTFKSKVTDHVGIGSLQINDENSDFEINFIPSADVQTGDTLQVVSKIPIELSVIQIPLFLNYHIKRGKLDWILHTGVSFDFLTAKINTLDFQVFKEGKKISKPVDFNSIKATEWGLSIYAGGGIKYDIGQHLSVGASAKFDLTGIIFSRYDLGVFYEF